MTAEDSYDAQLGCGRGVWAVVGGIWTGGMRREACGTASKNSALRGAMARRAAQQNLLSSPAAAYTLPCSSSQVASRSNALSMLADLLVIGVTPRLKALDAAHPRIVMLEDKGGEGSHSGGEE